MQQDFYKREFIWDGEERVEAEEGERQQDREREGRRKRGREEEDMWGRGQPKTRGEEDSRGLVGRRTAKDMWGRECVRDGVSEMGMPQVEAAASGLALGK